MKIVLISVVLIAAIFIAVLAYYGTFTSPIISQKHINPVALVYDKHIGAFKNTGPVLDKIYYRLLNEDNIQTTKAFGIYYDDPKTTEKKNLRSIVGWVIEDKDKIRVAELGNKYNFAEFPASDCIVAEYPYKGKLSVFLGALKVYPKLTDYLSSNNLPMVPVMEIYDQPGKKIIYIAAVHQKIHVFDWFLDNAR
ncbi:MAG: GyrI-like domain-containing protein [Desulfobacterales bacterium]|nr:GyrI-like domain-containing protein [Desulfobacterales bacterium]